jgi:hypothetical protein
MIRDLGIVQPGTTLYIPFHTFDSNDPSASVTLTGLATTDIEIYKDGSTTQRASDAGYALLDTDGIDFDATTGIHGISINLADNTTAGFYASGSQYWVVIASVTVDAATVNFVLCTFRIGYPAARLNTTIATLSSQTSFTLTAGPAEDDALNGCWCVIHDVASAVQCGHAIISDYTGSTKTVTLAAGTTFTAAATDNIAIMGPMPMQPTVSGRTLDVSTGGEAGIDWANVGTPGSTVGLSATTVATVTTATTATNVTTVNGLAANVITAASINTGAITSAKFAAGAIDAAAIATGAIDADAVAADAVTEIQNGLATAAALDTVDNFLDTEIAAIKAVTDKLDTTLVLDGAVYDFTAAALAAAPSGGLDAAGVRAAVGLASANLDTQLSTIDTVVDSILVDTAEIGAAGAGLTNINLPDQTMNITGNITGNLSGSVGSVTGAVGSVTGNVGGNVAGSVGSVTGAVGSVTGAVGSVTGLTASDVGAIKTKTDSLTFTQAGHVDANVQRINDVAITGDGGVTPFNVV